MPRARTFASVLVATAIAGLAGYAITWWVAREIGFADYATFAALWAALYLTVGGLAGIQQEFTRASQSGPGTGVKKATVFACAAAAIVFCLMVASSPLWVTNSFPVQRFTLLWPLAVGAASYVFVATISGVLYGLSAWRPLALAILIDPVLRLLALVAVLRFTHDVTVLAWVVVLPLPLTFVVVWLVVRRPSRRGFVVDVAYGQLAWNVVRVVVGAGSLSVMVSGLPLLIRATSHSEPDAAVGLLVLAITLTRAPLIVTVMSLQSILVVRFRDQETALLRQVATMVGVLAAVGVLLAILGWLLGPWVFSVLFPGETTPDGWLLAALVGSSVLVAVMCVTAAANLAKGQHSFLTAGWLAAATLTVLFLALPGDLLQRVLLALVVAPLGGLVVHGLGMVRSYRTAPVGHRVPTENIEESEKS